MKIAANTRLLTALTGVLFATGLIHSSNAQADSAPSMSDVATDASLASTVPKFYRDRGELVAGANPDIAPIKFIDEDGKISGFTPELLSAAAKVLGLNVRLTQASFDALVPGLSAGRFDVLLSLADFKSRHSAVTFVDYLNMGETVVATPSSKVALRSLEEMCGLQVAVPKGSGTIPEGGRISEKCVQEGKPAVTMATYPDSNMALLSVTTGASQVAWVDSPTGYYNAQKFPAKYKVIYFTYKAPYGIGFGPDEKGKQLATAMQKALLKLQKDGVYDALLKKWALSPKDAKPQFPINGAQL
ncbi:ABC transporter substrate-binding protein [Paraburkholderia dilworthii]|uniref:ABC transporter substrate-binding protein n=1 Tax=Paraburkholderia dilworthii TaxID=948106 RepID=UPI000569A997|nr:ABC transporter substrate-binding protein [Paraburkholderia dilworthii]